MMFRPHTLAAYALQRLPDAELAPPGEDSPQDEWLGHRTMAQVPYRMVRCALPMRFYKLSPLAIELERWKCPSGSHCWEEARFDRWTGATPVPKRVTLHAKDFYCQTSVDVTVPDRRRFDESGGKWKRSPPSRRCRLVSWCYASDETKLRYAPMLRNGRYPYGTDPDYWPTWAKHPHHFRRRSIGSVRVMLPFRVFRQEGVDLTAHLEKLFEAFDSEMHAKLARAESPPT